MVSTSSVTSFLPFIAYKKLPADTSPKPTIFLPSINEVNHQQAATYLCLLEKFFPDVIKVSWKEKNDNRVLPSQQGNTMKTNDTYMTFSWLTVTENSMKEEHMCIVKHEKNTRGKDQEILFPAVNEDTVQLQFTYNSAYYTYLLLLLKSAIYFVTTSCCVFRRTGVCCDGKNL
uniref:Ig-like domain-containing protein n=1 Tax=Bos indicus x Bos taurus TaxID=30522 RepID=A0A4W2IKI3_BOBOX